MTTASIDVAELPALASKKDVAGWLGRTTRSVELMVANGGFPKPSIRVGKSPRWRKSDLMNWLDVQGTQS